VQKKILTIALALGILLFCFLIYRAGPAQILDGIKALSWQSFLILMGLRLVYWILRTYNWKVVVECFDKGQPFLLLLEARLVANAISYLTPSAMLGGEPIRALMLDGPGRKKGLASVTLDKTIEIVTMALFTILAVLIALLWIPMPLRLKAVFAGFVGLVLALCLILLAKQRQGFFIWMVDALGKIRIHFRFIERNRDKIREIDSYISAFYREHRAKIPVVALLYSLTFLFWAVEIHMTLLFLHVPGLTFIKSLLVITLGNIALLVPTVPASLGVYEITNIGVFALLGWGAAIALSMAIIRRVIMLLWTGTGLLIMAKHQIKS
jgi:uncharacterized protein (TIRG00374 family)